MSGKPCPWCYLQPLHLFFHFFHEDPTVLGVGYNMCIPFRVEHSILSCSLHWPAKGLCVVIYCEEKFLWWEFRDALIYVYTNKSLGVIQIICLFIRIILLDSPLGPMTYLAIGFCLLSHCQVWVLSHGTGLNPIRKWLITSTTFMSVYQHQHILLGQSLCIL